MESEHHVLPASASKTDGIRILYITYDGLADPLGRSQIFPYLGGLARSGYDITILSCEKPARFSAEGERVRQLCAKAGIAWHPLRYHKQPPILSSVIDAWSLQRTALRLHRRQGFDIVHCRSYIPGRAGLALKRRFGVRFLFDMRGFWPDEKVEGNSWNLANPLYRAVYRYFKRLERQLLGGADHIVSLTDAGKAQLLTRSEVRPGAPISVIPCCVDFDRFPLIDDDSRQSSRRRLGIGTGDKVLAYLGSLGSWYMLEEMLDFFKVYASRHPDARFLFVTLEDPVEIRRTAAERGIDPTRLVIHPAGSDDVPKAMAAADLGIFFIKPVFSKTASSPTKMGEMLALGLPLVANAGVGDVKAMIDDMGCGVAVRSFTDESYRDAIDIIDAQYDGHLRLREKARTLFELSLGIERYDGIYRHLSSEKPMASSGASSRARNSALE